MSDSIQILIKAELESGDNQVVSGNFESGELQLHNYNKGNSPHNKKDSYGNSIDRRKSPYTSICGVPGTGGYDGYVYFNITGNIEIQMIKQEDGQHLKVRFRDIYIQQDYVKSDGGVYGTGMGWKLHGLIGNANKDTRTTLSSGFNIKDGKLTPGKDIGEYKEISWVGGGNPKLYFSRPDNSGPNGNGSKYGGPDSYNSYHWFMDLKPKVNSNWIDLGKFNPYKENSEVVYGTDNNGENAGVRFYVVFPITYSANSLDPIVFSLGEIIVTGVEKLLDYYPNARNNVDNINVDQTWKRFDSCNRKAGTGTAKSTGHMKKCVKSNDKITWEELKNQYGS